MKPYEWRLTGESLRLSALTDDQYAKILNLTEFAGHAVVVSRPWCLDRVEKATVREASGPHLQSVRSATTTNRGRIGTAFGIPLDAADDALREDSAWLHLGAVVSC